jgi:hypothetical protein
MRKKLQPQFGGSRFPAFLPFPLKIRHGPENSKNQATNN